MLQFINSYRKDFMAFGGVLLIFCILLPPIGFSVLATVQKSIVIGVSLLCFCLGFFCWLKIKLYQKKIVSSSKVVDKGR